MKSRSYTEKKINIKKKIVPDVIEVIHFYMTSAIHPITAIYQTADNIEPGSIKNKFYEVRKKIKKEKKIIRKGRKKDTNNK